jgi:hypothetical protein
MIASMEASIKKRSLATSCEPISSLDETVVRSMYAVFARHYDATSLSLFQKDLNSKDYAIVIRNEDGDAIVGFSTLAVMDTTLEGLPLRAIYSGDTIIDQAYWGTQSLSFNWLRFAGSIKAQAPDTVLCWFLIVKGHRTYRYLSTFSRDFYPHWERATTPWARRVMETLARKRFGEAFDAERCIVSFPESRGHLKSTLADVADDEAARPDVAFFLRQNPGYRRGDELVCVTELSLDNLRPLARRLFAQGLAA